VTTQKNGCFHGGARESTPGRHDRASAWRDFSDAQQIGPIALIRLGRIAAQRHRLFDLYDGSH
jgi:hypothetical protein